MSQNNAHSSILKDIIYTILSLVIVVIVFYFIEATIGPLKTGNNGLSNLLNSLPLNFLPFFKSAIFNQILALIVIFQILVLIITGVKRTLTN